MKKTHLLCVFHAQDTHWIQQQLHSFPTLSFAADALGETLLVVLDVPCQTQFQVDCSIPCCIPAYPKDVPIDLSCACPFFNIPYISFFHLRTARTSLLFHAGLLPPLLDFGSWGYTGLEFGCLNIDQLSWAPFPSRALFHGIPLSRSLERLNLLSGKSGF